MDESTPFHTTTTEPEKVPNKPNEADKYKNVNLQGTFEDLSPTIETISQNNLKMKNITSRIL